MSTSGCGSEADGGVPIEEFRARYWQAFCENWVGCGSYENMEACLAANDFPNTDPEYANQSAVQAGTKRYDGEKAEECIELLRNWGCFRSAEPTREDRTESCFKVFSGTLSLGDSCRPGECSHAYCRLPDTCADACCLGVCEEGIPYASLGVGEACYDTYLCEYGLWCGDDGTCQPLEVEGARCTPIGPETCVYGLICADDGTGWKTCQRATAHGEACISNTNCDDRRDFCDHATMTCTKRPGIGEACEGGDCDEFATCSSTDGCQADPTQVGEACDGYCLGHLECSLPYGGTCEAPAPSPDCRGS